MRVRLTKTLPPPPEPTIQDLFLNPFGAGSAHHRPMGSGAQYATETNVITAAFRNATFGTVNTPTTGAGAVFVQNASTDPTRTITASGSSPFGTLPVTLKMPTISLNQTGDRTVIIYNVVGDGKFYECYHFSWNSGQPTADGCRIHDPHDYGHKNGVRVGVSATGLSLVVGLQRGFELSGTGPIQHVMHGSMLSSSPVQAKNQFIWPASFVDGFCSQGGCNGDIPYGQLFALPPTLDKGSLSLSALGLRMFDQLQNYGIYIIDTTSGAKPNCRGDQDCTPSVISDFSTQMQKMWGKLLPILNNLESQTCSGGGTPLAINSAYNAP